MVYKKLGYIQQHIKYTNKQMDVQKAWLYSLNRYYAYKVYKQIDGCIKYTKPLQIKMDVQKAWLYSLNRYYAYKVYKQIDGCTKSLAIFTKPLLCI